MINHVRSDEQSLRNCVIALLSAGIVAKSDVKPLLLAAIERFKHVNFISNRKLVVHHPDFGSVKAVETLHFNQLEFIIEAYVLGEDYFPLIRLHEHGVFPLPQQATFHLVFDKIARQA